MRNGGKREGRNKESGKERRGQSLVAQWLGHCTFTAEGAGLILKSHRAGGRGSLMCFHYDSVFCIGEYNSILQYNITIL